MTILSWADVSLQAEPKYLYRAHKASEGDLSAAVLDSQERFGDWKAVHTRFSRWAERGVWERVFQHLAVEADTEYAMIDSTIVRAHQHSAGARKKGNNILDSVRTI